jgi:hypothetical protein
MEAAMKKFITTAFLGLWLLSSFGCSSIPSGTVAIKDLMADPEEQLGVEVVLVGTAEIRTEMSSFGMFKLYQGNDFIWVTLPEDDTEEPPQGIKVRVSGILQQKEFTVIGEVYYILATKVAME